MAKLACLFHALGFEAFQRQKRCLQMLDSILDPVWVDVYKDRMFESVVSVWPNPLRHLLWRNFLPLNFIAELLAVAIEVYERFIDESLMNEGHIRNASLYWWGNDNGI